MGDGVILAAADPELHSHYSASAYGLGIVRFLIIAVVLLVALRAVEVAIRRRITRRRRSVNSTAQHDMADRYRRALDRGDSQILRAVEQREHAHRERVTVPRRLTDRSHR